MRIYKVIPWRLAPCHVIASTNVMAWIDNNADTWIRITVDVLDMSVSEEEYEALPEYVGPRRNH